MDIQKDVAYGEIISTGAVSQRPWVRFPAAPPFFKPLFSHSKGLRTVMARLRSLIRPSLISPWTKLIGVPTIRLPAVITLKIPPNQQSYAATILIQSTLIMLYTCTPQQCLCRMMLVHCLYMYSVLHSFRCLCVWCVHVCAYVCTPICVNSSMHQVLRS